MEIIAHRGASRERTENTMAAFERALELGADAIELDVHATADGRIVVHHDPVVGPDMLLIASTPVDKVQAAGARSGIAIPFLEDVMDLARGTARLYVEVTGAGMAALVAGILEADADW